MSVKQVNNEYLRLKKEVTRKSNMANKRLTRLKNNHLTDTPAYKNWLNYKGGVKFSVKGKDYNQLQQELSRVNKFIKNKTSTVRGANKVLKEMAKNTGIKYKSIKELQVKSKKFFELYNLVTQNLRKHENSASAIFYKHIWTSINNYIAKEKIELCDDDLDIDYLVQEISELTKYENSYDDDIHDNFSNFEEF